MSPLLLLILAQPILSTEFTLVPDSERPGKPVVLVDGNAFTVLYPAGNSVGVLRLAPGEQHPSRAIHLPLAASALIAAQTGPLVIVGNGTGMIEGVPPDTTTFALEASCVAAVGNGAFVSAHLDVPVRRDSETFTVSHIRAPNDVVRLDAGYEFSFTDTTFDGPFCATSNAGAHVLSMITSTFTMSPGVPELHTVDDRGLSRVGLPSTDRLIYFGSGHSSVLVVREDANNGPRVDACSTSTGVCQLLGIPESGSSRLITSAVRDVAGVDQFAIIGVTQGLVTAQVLPSNGGGAIRFDAGTTDGLSSAIAGTVGLLTLHQVTEDGGSIIKGRWINAAAAGESCDHAQQCASGVCFPSGCLDVAPVDAGEPMEEDAGIDAGFEPTDAGAERDAGVDAGTIVVHRDLGVGCGCGSARSSLFVLAALVLRRKRGQPAAAAPGN